MEQAMNRIILIGTTGRDPEARGAQNNIINCSLAVDSYSKGEKGVDWFNLVLFGATGESFMKAVTKGKHIAIEGKIKTRTWEKDGRKMQDIDVVVDNWRFVGAKVPDNSTPISGPSSWGGGDSSWP
jgi:single-strand DNA-binding protein